MFGNFQKSILRIELSASLKTIGDSLLRSQNLKQWLWFASLAPGMPETLHPGLTFTTQLGLVKIQQKVEVAGDNCLRLLLSEGVDGFHEWYWGEGWVQSRLEGFSILPLNLAQTLSLLSLRQYLATEQLE